MRHRLEFCLDNGCDSFISLCFLPCGTTALALGAG
jgi:hypothetical protein